MVRSDILNRFSSVLSSAISTLQCNESCCFTHVFAHAKVETWIFHLKGVTRHLLVVSQSWPNLVFRLNRLWGIQWCLYFCSSMCGLEVRRVARYSRAPSFSAVFYRIEIFYLIIFYPNGTYKTSTSFFHHIFSLYFLIRYVFEWQK